MCTLYKILILKPISYKNQNIKFYGFENRVINLSNYYVKLFST